MLGILDVLEGTVLRLLNGIGAAINGFIDGARQIIGGGMDIVVGIFTGSGDRIIVGLRGVVNGFISIVEGLLDGVITGVVGFVNGIADGLSRIPGVDIPSISFTSVNLPRLAGGAVIPPNREFLAVLGDQRSGSNIEAPEGLIRQIVREESAPGMDQAQLQAAIVSALLQVMPMMRTERGEGDVVMNMDGREVMRALVPHLEAMARTGEFSPTFV